MFGAPVGATVSVSLGLTVPAVRTGMKGGVSIGPFAVVKRPSRAAPAQWKTSKAKFALMALHPRDRAGKHRHKRRSDSPGAWRARRHPSSDRARRRPPPA